MHHLDSPWRPSDLEQREGRAIRKGNEIAKHFAQINDRTLTHGEYFKIGTLCGFNLLVKTEESQKEGLFAKQTQFFVEGEGNVKYTYNNGSIAQDPKLAVMYFLHALEKIPSLIEKCTKETEKLTKDLPVLQEIVGSSWRKENELKDLKTELAALDRKIQLSLKPIEQNVDKSENKQQNEQSQHTLRL